MAGFGGVGELGVGQGPPSSVFAISAGAIATLGALTTVAASAVRVSGAVA